MIGEIWARLANGSGTTFGVFVASALILGFDLGSASYVMALFKRWGETGFITTALVLTGVLAVTLLFRFVVDRVRRGAVTALLASGPEGDVALIMAAAKSDPAKRPAMQAAVKSVTAAFCAANLLALFDLPAAIAFTGAVFVVAGSSAGVACSTVLVLVILLMDFAARRSRRLAKGQQSAEIALAKADTAEASAELAVEVYARRVLVEGAAATDRAIGVMASGLMLIAAVGVGCILNDPSATPATLVTANILAGRALGVVISAMGSLARMSSAMPAKLAIDSELNA